MLIERAARMIVDEGPVGTGPLWTAISTATRGRTTRTVRGRRSTTSSDRVCPRQLDRLLRTDFVLVQGGLVNAGVEEYQLPGTDVDVHGLAEPERLTGDPAPGRLSHHLDHAVVAGAAVIPFPVSFGSVWSCPGAD